MNKPFAKLFEIERGQILVKLDAGEDGAPEIRFYAQPEGLGVCSVALAYEDSDKGWDAAEQVFEQIDEPKAMTAAAEIFQMAAKFTEAA
ncbi:hypothetical protein AAFM71_07530 [Chromobacterium violaceum]|uniref:hypothetical protein n=1 Tax=Chromobacterium violaceum TaxID=536 RepID=UPI00385AAD30